MALLPASDRAEEIRKRMASEPVIWGWPSGSSSADSAGLDQKKLNQSEAAQETFHIAHQNLSERSHPEAAALRRVFLPYTVRSPRFFARMISANRLFAGFQTLGRNCP